MQTGQRGVEDYGAGGRLHAAVLPASAWPRAAWRYCWLRAFAAAGEHASIAAWPNLARWLAAAHEGERMADRQKCQQCDNAALPPCWPWYSVLCQYHANAQWLRQLRLAYPEQPASAEQASMLGWRLGAR